PTEGAGISAWDVRAARHALAAVLRRRPEAYHETLRAHDAKAAAEAAAAVAVAAADNARVAAGGAPDPTVAEGGAPVSIHDIVLTKEAGLSALLHYDDHERRTALVRFLDPAATPEQYATAAEREIADFRDGEFMVDHLAPGQVSLSREGNVLRQPVGLSKTIRLMGGRLDPELLVELEVHHRGTLAIEARLGVELGVHLLGGGGNPSAWYDVGGERTSHDSAGTASGLGEIGYGNDWVGVAVTARPEPPADAWWSPIETVSNSESGFERVYQGSALLLSWPVRLEPGSVTRFAVRQSVTVTRDRDAEERAARA
ncbi:MAG TPA: alpha-amylase/4-alpha-glucanotransferase domain-containing protein, partial [Candidatus Limnocylindrales bacterium]